MVVFKQAFACAHTANCVAALEMVLWLWRISLDGDLGRISVGCVQKCVVSWLLAWKIEDIWMPLTTSVLTCFPPSCGLCHPPSGSFCSACAHPSPRAKSCGPPWLVDCDSYLESQMLSSAAVHSNPLGHPWQSFYRHRGEEKPLVSEAVQFWDSKWFWNGTVFIALEPVGQHVLVSKSRKEFVLSQINFEVFPLTLHQLSQPLCSSFSILVSLSGQALLLCSDGVFVHSARRG